MSAVEDRLADALSARAQLETVDAPSLQQRREELRAAVDDGVASLDSAGAGGGDEALTVLTALDELAARRRRRVVALAAAAAALVLVAAALGIVRSSGGAALPPASGGSGDFSILRIPHPPVALPDDVVAPEGLVEDSVLDLLLTAPLSAWIATDDQQRTCLVVSVAEPRDSASACGDREQAEATGIGLDLADVGLTAVLVPDGADSAPYLDQGLLPVAPHLWVDADTAARIADAEVRATSADSFVVEPFVGTGTADLPPLTDEGQYAVLLRCLTDRAVHVEVDGVAQLGEPECGGSWSIPTASPVALLQVSGGPVTVTLRAPEGAAWSVGVVRCSPVARQCPTVPAVTMTSAG